jgi:hypothetical protein
MKKARSFSVLISRMMDRNHTGANPDRETELYPNGIECEPPVQG